MVEQALPLASFNPFSPVKDKGKQRLTAHFVTVPEISSTNPFATPPKRKPKRSEMRQPSPDPFPLIQPLPSQSLIHTSPVPLQAPTSPLSRARKRLRGEPVSPSPYKEKRQRTSSQNTLPLAALGTYPATDDISDDLDETTDANLSIVNDSPVKSVGGKAFKLLFDEPIPRVEAPIKPKVKGKLARSKTAPASAKLFQGHFSNNLFQSNAKSNLGAPSLPVIKGSETSQRNHTVNGNFVHLQAVLEADDSPSPEETPNGLAASSSTSRRSSEHHLPSKRTLLDAVMENNDTANKTFSFSQLPLLRPSPPPIDSSNGSYSKARAGDKGKGPSSKKAKVLKESNGDSEDEDPLESGQVKLVDRRPPMSSQPIEGQDDIYDDSILRWPPFRQPQNPSVTVADPSDDAAEFHVDLPDKLRHVLAITPSNPQFLKEERVVRELLYRERLTHYDPSKGGEIWGVGEEEEKAQDDAVGEDDWEGEPVPWEVGEL